MRTGISTPGRGGGIGLRLVASSLIVSRPNTNPPTCAKYATPPPAASRVGQARGAEHRLLGEPDPEHHERRQLDHGEEQDDDHERQHPRARIQDDVAAEDRRDRARMRRPSAPWSSGRPRPAARAPRPRRGCRSTMNLTGPIESSTLLPKIHRNSMLPAMWRIEACMNIAGEDRLPGGERCPARAPRPHASSRRARDLRATSQWAPGWVSASGIAPYLNTSCVPGPLISDPPCLIARK